MSEIIHATREWVNSILNSRGIVYSKESYEDYNKIPLLNRKGEKVTNLVDILGDSGIFKVSISREEEEGYTIDTSVIVFQTTHENGLAGNIYATQTIIDASYKIRTRDITIDNLDTLETIPFIDRVGDVENSINTIINKVDSKANKTDVDIMGENISELQHALPYKAEIEYVNSLAELNTIVNTAEGSTINMTDSANANLKGLNIYGKTTQPTTTGAQLIPFPYKQKEDISINGGTFTIQEDGGIKASGTPTGYIGISLYSGPLLVDSTSKITMSLTGKELKEVALQIGLYDDSDNLIDNSYSITANTYITIDLNEYPNATIMKISLKRNNDNKTMQGIAYPMINIGDTALPWEPYTGGIASPSVKYEQPLINVGNEGSITTKIYGANLFNPSFVTVGSAKRPIDTPLLSNSYGTTINSTSYSERDTVVVTQKNFTTDIPNYYQGHYANGYVIFGLYNNILKYDRNYTFIADIKITNILSGSNGALSALVSAGGASKTVIKNNKLYHNFNFVKGNITYPDARYFEIRCNGVSFELSNIMIVEGNAVGALPEYEPFTEQTFTFNTPNGLPGVPVASGGNYTDENGQQYVCDEIDGARSKYIQRIGIYTTGQYDTVTRGKIEETTGEYQCFYLYNKIPSNNNTLHDNSGAFCNKFIHQSVYNRTFEGFYISDAQKDGNTDDVTISIKIDRLSNYGYSATDANSQVTAFNAWLKDNPLTFVYIMAEPIETDLDLTPEEIAQYNALITYKPVTNVYNDAEAHTKVTYVADPKNYIDNKIDEKYAILQSAILKLGGVI